LKKWQLRPISRVGFDRELLAKPREASLNYHKPQALKKAGEKMLKNFQAGAW